ncbi:CheY-like superfamily [Pseudocohnilembus persalinus]|uniref:CheY-like superfamily n=1 Tax=Pseudocohnilembus persalinus TaxID=266149 RepID=A0A0V0QXJ5_PSEPJ|nr:CheY-like superfamily [Pseudocohnilembus persalinus]|eukprot:KRX06946.1 CheY-like superfamily [Pseudocohnilembus persalinus]
MSQQPFKSDSYLSTFMTPQFGTIFHQQSSQFSSLNFQNLQKQNSQSLLNNQMNFQSLQNFQNNITSQQNVILEMQDEKDSNANSTIVHKYSSFRNNLPLQSNQEIEINQKNNCSNEQIQSTGNQEKDLQKKCENQTSLEFIKELNPQNLQVPKFKQNLRQNIVPIFQSYGLIQDQVKSGFFQRSPERKYKTITINKEKNQNLNQINPQILIVDDDKFTRQALQQMIFQKYNQQVALAQNGEEALNKFKEKLMLENQPYKLIIMDIDMPVINGIEATKQIRKIMNKLKKFIQQKMQSKLENNYIQTKKLKKKPSIQIEQSDSINNENEESDNKSQVSLKIYDDVNYDKFKLISKETEKLNNSQSPKYLQLQKQQEQFEIGNELQFIQSQLNNFNKEIECPYIIQHSAVAQKYSDENKKDLFDEYLSKPLILSKLQKVITKLFNQ